MDELKREIREVFDRQQRPLGSLAGVRERVMRDALAPAEPRSRRSLRLAGGAVAVLLAALIVGTLILARESGRAGTPAGTPTTAPFITPTPVPTPSVGPTALHVTQPLRVADSVPVIMFHDPDDPEVADAVTWDGRAVGRVGSLESRMLGPNPSGSLYATGQSLRDRTGAVVASLALKESGMVWADDGHHYCTMDRASGLPPAGGEPTTLRVNAPGEQARTVVQVGTAFQQSGPNVLACSVLGNRAVITQGGPPSAAFTRLWVVDLSNGRIVWSRSYPADGSDIAGFAASRDGRYVAEMRGSLTQPEATIYDASGATVTHVHGTVNAFSWDDSLAVVSTGGATPTDSRVTVVRWRDGATVWTGPAGRALAAADPEPGGQRLAVALTDPSVPSTSGFPIADVYAVAPDGGAVLLVRAVPL
ncbi:MAG TPA: hypothetical protein VIC57_00305 [Candidatus Dormibacteraeota bacterium]|jgi:hypothetical protein